MSENESKSNDSILFWLEQEPVESNADIYLPADTPIYRPAPKILFQINKKQELKKQRTIERLKAYHYEKLADCRKSFATKVTHNKLPNRKPEGFFEQVKSTSYLQDNIEDIVKLLEDINDMKPNKGIHQLLTQHKPVETETQEQLEKNKAIEDEKEEYGKSLEEEFTNQVIELRKEYDKTVNLLLRPKKENEQPRNSTTTTTTTIIEHAPLPPLPPRVSRTDPRERFLEEYPPTH